MSTVSALSQDYKINMKTTLTRKGGHMSFIWRLKRMVSNILFPWKRGQRALWYEHRQIEKKMRTISHHLNELTLSIENANAGSGTVKRKRGRPRKK